MEINRIYTFNEILKHGLQPNSISNVSFRVFQHGDKVFFFEPLGTESFRLYSIISKKSFFL